MSIQVTLRAETFVCPNKRKMFDKSFRVCRLLEQLSRKKLSRIHNMVCFRVKFRERAKSKKNKFEFSLNPLLFERIRIS